MADRLMVHVVYMRLSPRHNWQMQSKQDDAARAVTLAKHWEWQQRTLTKYTLAETAVVTMWVDHLNDVPDNRKVLPRFTPPEYACRVGVWEERDRLHVHLYYMDEDHTVAEWWDDDARQMFEDGFFRSGQELKASVLEYGVAMGLLLK